MISKYDCQVIFRHYWKQGLKATEAVRIINAMEGENTITIRTAQVWFKKFSEGDINLFWAAIHYEFCSHARSCEK